MQNIFFVVHDQESYEKHPDLIGFYVKTGLDGKPIKDKNDEFIPDHSLVNKIKLGDRIIYYTRGDYLIRGIFEVKEKLKEDSERRAADWQPTVQFVIAPVLKPKTSVDFRNLIFSAKYTLDMFKHLENLKRQWGMSIGGRNYIRKITMHDYEIIEKAIERLLDSEKIKLKAKMFDRKAKFLFVVLESLNYFFGGKLKTELIGDFTRINIEQYRVIVSLRAILDTILENGVSAVQWTSREEFPEILRILTDHLNLGVLMHQLYVQRTYPAYEAKIENGRVEDTKDKEFYEAVQHWVNVAGADPAWTNWYFNNYRKHRDETGKLLEREFPKVYGLKLSDLTDISNYLQKICEEHLKSIAITPPTSDSMPFLHIKRKKIRGIFESKMTKREATKWIKMLEYKKGRDPAKHPLIPVKLQGKKIYTLMTWVFTPSNSFWGAWVSDLLLARPELSARGKWAEGYGKVFQRYVDEKVTQSKLPVENIGSRKISIAEYPEIEPWTKLLRRKQGFEIDRFFLSGNTLFIVFCKARDFLYDRKIWRRDVFFPNQEIEKKVEQNIEDMNEIYIEADCIASCKRIREKLTLPGKTFIPIVLTSRMEPMGVPEVRTYYSKKINFPNVPVLTIEKFIELLKAPSKIPANAID